ncbi:Uncharacterised protein [Serratia marcescens]|uniref:hypothetical protein n=1 Tax=Serratia TaxID=613 RepID=UPI0018D68B5D|nr:MULTISPECIES: hypothetical protein [Serratia]MBH3104497.1 hypothetical protein [Serratia marcescens]MCW7610282.1 hypothetical protein [Serratia bockelmannii]CAI1893851.1 Uncharacterised protein [Serratia marcescens]
MTIKKENTLQKSRLVKMKVKGLFLIACILLFICGILSYKQYILESMSNSYHGLLFLDGEEKIKLNLYLSKDRETAYIRLIQSDGDHLRYITAEMELNALLTHSIATAKVDLHERNMTESAFSSDSRNRLVSVLLHKNSKQYFLVINKDDFYIPTGNNDINELIFLIFPDK